MAKEYTVYYDENKPTLTFLKTSGLCCGSFYSYNDAVKFIEKTDKWFVIEHKN